MNAKKIQGKKAALILLVLAVLFCSACAIALTRPGVRFMLVRLLNMRAGTEEKIAAFERFVERNPSYLPARLSAAGENMAYGLLSPDNAQYADKAMEHYYQIMEYNNYILRVPADDETTIRNIVRIYSSRGETDKLERLYDRLMRHDPDNPDHYMGMARVCFRRGDIDGAYTWASKALGTDPERYDARMLKAMIYARRNDLGRAIYNCEKAVSGYVLLGKSEEEFSARRVLGRMYLRAMLNVKALGEFERVMELRPERFEAHIEVANTHIRLNNPDGAISVILDSQPGPISAERGRGSAFTRAMAYYTLGQAHLMKHDLIAGRAYFKKAEALGLEYAPGFLEGLDRLVDDSGLEEQFTRGIGEE